MKRTQFLSVVVFLSIAGWRAQAAGEDELKAFVKERLAAYKYPRTIEFIDELPKTATGKIQRFRLRERSAP